MHAWGCIRLETRQINTESSDESFSQNIVSWCEKLSGKYFYGFKNEVAQESTNGSELKKPPTKLEIFMETVENIGDSNHDFNMFVQFNFHSHQAYTFSIKM